MLGKIVLADRIFAVIVAAGLVGRWGVHASEMLREEIFAVEVVIVECRAVGAVVGSGTQIAAPEPEPDVLGAHVPLPLVLGCKGGCA